MEHTVLHNFFCKTATGRFCIAFLLVTAFFFIQRAGAEEELNFDDVIRMLDDSEKQFSYLGTKFVIDYTPSQRSTTLVKVTHSSGLRKKEVASLKPGESSQVILDDGKFLWHYIPSQASVVKKKQRITLGRISKRIASQGELIQQNYDIHIKQIPQSAIELSASSTPSVGGDVMIAFQPKTQDRPSWKIWLERKHGLIVRTEVYDTEGDLALLSAFSELTFQPKLSKKSFVMKVPKGTTVQNSMEKYFRTVEEAQKETGFPISVPGYISPGFELASVIQSPSKRGEKVQLSYVDGMSSISIFEEKHAGTNESASSTSKEVSINQSIKGTFHDHGLLKILRWRVGQDFYLTLVGEVADAELLKIAASLSEETAP
jgi:outer membrane lipoprotein-sorting protein